MHPRSLRRPLAAAATGLGFAALAAAAASPLLPKRAVAQATPSLMEFRWDNTKDYRKLYYFMTDTQRLKRAEYYLLKIPVFRTVYAPVKQLLNAFAPDNQSGFKRVVLVEEPGAGFLLGFLTREFVLDRGRGPEALIAVYVPTNHLYLGDVRVFPAGAVTYPDLTVEDGISLFLTGGMSLGGRVRVGGLAGPARPGAGPPDPGHGLS